MSANNLGMLEHLDKEIKDTSALISRKISSLKAVEKSREPIDEIKNELEQYRNCVHDMELELRSLDTSNKNKWQERVHQYKTDLRSLQRDFEREKAVAQRNELFPGATDSANLTTTNEQARLIVAGDQERKNTHMLEMARKELYDTEKQAMDISGELAQQKNKMLRIKLNLGEGNTTLGRVGRILNGMRRRQAFMSVMWCCIIVIIITVISIIVYFKVAKKK